MDTTLCLDDNNAFEEPMGLRSHGVSRLQSAQSSFETSLPGIHGYSEDTILRPGKKEVSASRWNSKSKRRSIAMTKPSPRGEEAMNRAKNRTQQALKKRHDFQKEITREAHKELCASHATGNLLFLRKLFTDALGAEDHRVRVLLKSPKRIQAQLEPVFAAERIKEQSILRRIRKDIGYYCNHEKPLFSRRATRRESMQAMLKRIQDQHALGPHPKGAILPTAQKPGSRARPRSQEAGSTSARRGTYFGLYAREGHTAEATASSAIPKTRQTQVRATMPLYGGPLERVHPRTTGDSLPMAKRLVKRRARTRSHNTGSTSFQR